MGWRGYRPADFGLERIFVGGEIVTEGLKARSQRLFGDARVIDSAYGMTEIWPFGGQSCEEGHLHYEVSQGLVEVLDPETAPPPNQARLASSSPRHSIPIARPRFCCATKPEIWRARPGATHLPPAPSARDRAIAGQARSCRVS